MNYSYAIKVATDFIKSAEDIATVLPNADIQAYWDSKGEVWTIGWGNTYYKDGSAVNQGDTLTRTQADDLLEYVVTQKEKAIRSYVTAKINENQYAALISVAYNCGEGNLRSSDLLKLINQGASQAAIEAQFLKTCVTSNGNYVQGLYNRRVNEFKLFINDAILAVSNNVGISVVLTGLTLFGVIGYYIYRAAKMKK